MDSTCKIDGCDARVKARGWCSGHYSRWQRNGDVDADMPIRTDLATPAECPKAYDSGCRCDGCREVKRTYVRQWQEDNLQAVRARPVPPGKHGTSSGYSYYQCRCDKCRAWKRLDPATRAARGRYRARLQQAQHVPYDIRDLHARDGGKCGICGHRVDLAVGYPHPQSPSIDHILPLSEGGDDTPNNVQVTHLTCNVSKGTGGTDQLRLVG